MEPDLNKAIRQLPSVATFAERIAEDLEDNRSVIALLPEGVDREWVLPLVQSRLFSSGIRYRECPPVAICDRKDCASQIAAALGIVGDNGLPPWSARSFMKINGLPSVVILTADSGLGAHETGELLGFVTEWAMLVHQEANLGRRLPAFLVIVSGRQIPIEIPDTDLYLSVRFWWGIPSLTETRVLTMRCLTDGMLWEEYALSSIASGDLVLLARLLDSRRNGKTLGEALAAHGKNAGWSLEDLAQAKSLLCSELNGRRCNSGAPPKILIHPWATGMIGYTPERGLAMSAAALAMIGAEDETNHRLWTGQAELLLPLIDSFRLRLCDYLTEKFGKSWPTNWIAPNDEELSAVKTNPRACQWGHISAIFGASEKLKRMDRLHDAVKHLRYVRNELAHFRPITEGEYTRLRTLMEKAF
jgi:hypothetical protein